MDALQSSDWNVTAVALVVLSVFGFLMAYVWFKASNLITPIRVSAETELAGLDMPEMGVTGYPDFVISNVGASSPHEPTV